MRVRRANSLYHLEGEHLEAIYSTGGELHAKYLRGAVIDEVVNGYRFDAEGKATNHTFHHDQVTSVIALSGHNGSFEQFATYYPFGEDLGAYEPDVNSLRFTGRERDPDTGLYYYRARYYDPEIGRFLSEDPLGFDGGDVNLYSYVGNNPLRFNDPLGLIDLLFGVGGSLVAPTGVEGSAGIFIGQNDNTLALRGGGFVAFGAGAGVNVSADATTTLARSALLSSTISSAVRSSAEQWALDLAPLQSQGQLRTRSQADLTLSVQSVTCCTDLPARGIRTLSEALLWTGLTRPFLLRRIP